LDNSYPEWLRDWPVETTATGTFLSAAGAKSSREFSALEDKKLFLLPLLKLQNRRGFFVKPVSVASFLSVAVYPPVVLF
jgi:hypothetical protein